MRTPAFLLPMKKHAENTSSKVQEKYALLHSKYNLVNDNIDMSKLGGLDAGHRLNTLVTP